MSQKVNFIEKWSIFDQIENFIWLKAKHLKPNRGFPHTEESLVVFLKKPFLILLSRLNDVKIYSIFPFNQSKQEGNS